MTNLEQKTGLPVSLDEKSLELEFQGLFPQLKKSERSLSDLSTYLKNPDIVSGPDPVYKVWRNAEPQDFVDIASKSRLRFDFTLISPGLLESELPRTAGHFHQKKSGTSVSFPEVYEVILGKAYFLIQDFEENPGNVRSVFLIEAGSGEKVMIPPGFGHISINASASEPLLLANWISEDCAYDYIPYQKNRGGAYWIVLEDSKVETLPNSHYIHVPDLQKIKTQEFPEFGLVKNQPLYDLVKSIGNLKFLNFPEEFADKLNIETLYL